MATRIRTTKKTSLSAKRLISLIAMSSIGAAIVGLMVGYFLGAATASTTFTATQAKFIQGVVYGTDMRHDFEDWTNEKAADTDPRSSPKVRCAARFFPDDAIAMSGCVQALEDPGPGGYKVPTFEPEPQFLR